MVNTGKPSAGCHLCRSRRIKCDEAKPQCMRCVRSRRPCPGYRGPSEGRYGDQASRTKKRAPVSGTLGSRSPSPNSTTSISETRTRGTAQENRRHSRSDSGISIESLMGWSDKSNSLESCEDSLVSIPRQFSTPLDQQAGCYFLANFVVVSNQSKNCANGHFDFLIPLLTNGSHETHLMLTFNAVALAALGKDHANKSRGLIALADRHYIAALKHINLALQNPSKAKDNSTLASVLLLSCFEQLSRSPLSMSGWMSHIDGAVAVVKSRGKQLLETEVGRKLFDAIRTHMMVQCLANSRYVNTEVEWWVEGRDTDEPLRIVSALNLRVANLRADSHTIIRSDSSNDDDVRGHLRAAQALEQEYADWQENLPEDWKPTSSCWIDSVAELDFATTDVYPGRVDSYSEAFIATNHNMARTARLFIITTIMRCTAKLCAPLDYRMTPEYVTASRHASQLIEDIIAATPYFLGWHKVLGRDTLDGGSSNHILGKGVTGIWAMYPLFAASTSDFATYSQRLWMRGRLKYISEELGVDQAGVLLQVPVRYPSTYIMRDRGLLPQGVWDGYPAK